MRRLFANSGGNDTEEVGRRPAVIQFHGCGSFHRPVSRESLLQVWMWIPAMASYKNTQGTTMRSGADFGKYLLTREAVAVKYD